MPNPPGFLSRQRVFVLTEQDERDISAALRAAFPSLVFVATNCLHTTVYTSENDYTEDPPGPGPVLPLNDTLVSLPAVEHIRGYLLEPDWEPGWRHRKILRSEREIWRPILSNEPRLWFEYQDSWFGHGDDHWRSSAGRVWAWYPREDKECARFVSAVMRTFTKFCTNALDPVYDDTGEWHSYESPRTIWAGRGAVEWCTTDPMRRIAGHLRPQGSVGAPVPRHYWSYGSCKNKEAAVNYAAVTQALAELKVDGRKKRRDANN